MLTWKKIDRNENAEGTTITYASDMYGKTLLIQSRKRHMPHASGIGTWDHTTYFVIYNGVDLKECWSLKDAKECAETVTLKF